MEIKIVKGPINIKDILDIAEKQFGEMVKVVVDIEQGIMAIGGEMHADEEVELIEKQGSNRENTWGINIYPGRTGEDWIEFDSMVNIKPSFGNRSREVDNPEIQKKIRDIVGKLVLK